jgi:hypothetical protein
VGRGGEGRGGEGRRGEERRGEERRSQLVWLDLINKASQKPVVV